MPLRIKMTNHPRRAIAFQIQNINQPCNPLETRISTSFPLAVLPSSKVTAGGSTAPPLLHCDSLARIPRTKYEKNKTTNPEACCDQQQYQLFSLAYFLIRPILRIRISISFRTITLHYILRSGLLCNTEINLTDPNQTGISCSTECASHKKPQGKAEIDAE